MLIIETKIFTKIICELLSDETYRSLQIIISNEPEKGKIIKGSKGLRKIRWINENKGKSGGIRIIYYWSESKNIILMLYAYSKSVTNDLTQAQIKILSKIIEDNYK